MAGQRNNPMAWVGAVLAALAVLGCCARAGADGPATQPALRSDALRDLAQAILAAPTPETTGTTEHAALRAAAERHEVAQTQPAAAAKPPALPANELRPIGAPGSTGEGAPAPAGPRGSQTPWWMTTAGALAVVLALIFLFRALLTRWAGRSGTGANSPLIEVLHRAAVAPRQHVLLIRMGSRLLLVNESTNGLRTLAHIRDPQEVADLLANLAAGKSSSASTGFHELMQRVTGTQHQQDNLETGGDDREYVVDSAREELSGLAARLKTLGAAPEAQP